MACCQPEIFVGNSAISDIPYTAAMVQKYGPLPSINVYYLVDGNWVAAGIFTLKQFNGSSILVDHGGVSQWLVKVN